MALVVETGAGLSNANSFASRAEWVAYWTDLNDETLADKDDEVIDAALIIATRDVDQSFDWTGSKRTLAQALGWPRSGALDKEGNVIATGTIPDVLKEAVFQRGREHIDVRALDTPLSPDDLPSRLKVGPVELEWERLGLSDLPENRFYRLLLKGLYIGGDSSQHEIVRA